MWVLWLAQCKEGMRCGDTIKSRGEANQRWDPSKETNLGQLLIEILRDSEGISEVEKILLAEKLTKTDPSGMQGSEKGLLI